MSVQLTAPLRHGQSHRWSRIVAVAAAIAASAFTTSQLVQPDRPAFDSEYTASAQSLQSLENTVAAEFHIRPRAATPAVASERVWREMARGIANQYGSR
jgi:hypothetical protein